MYKALSPGAIGVSTATAASAIEAAVLGGFRGVELNPDQVVAEGIESVQIQLIESNVLACGWGLPVEWRRDEDAWRAGLDRLSKQAATAAKLGATRCSTWVLPMSDDRELSTNIAWHIDRFKPIAEILGEHGCSLGLEFIGPQTLRSQGHFEFVYRMLDMLDLAQSIGPNVGLLVDAFHWYTSEGTVDELKQLKANEVVYVHVNDGLAGRSADEQIDQERALPGETGVIDIAGFLRALQEIGYTGPIVAEPFSASLKALPNDTDRLKAVSESLDKVLASSR